MTRADYEVAVCARVAQAVRVPFQQVALEGWSPKVADCHRNVARQHGWPVSDTVGWPVGLAGGRA